MSPLTPEQVAELLESSKPKSKPKSAEPKHHLEQRYNGIVQVGIVKDYDKERRCASKGCGSPTHWVLEGIPYCTVHLINHLNAKFIDPELPKICDCKAGHYSFYRVHIDTCPVYKKVKETE